MGPKILEHIRNRTEFGSNVIISIDFVTYQITRCGNTNTILFFYKFKKEANLKIEWMRLFIQSN